MARVDLLAELPAELHVEALGPRLVRPPPSTLLRLRSTRLPPLMQRTADVVEAVAVVDVVEVVPPLVAAPLEAVVAVQLRSNLTQLDSFCFPLPNIINT